MGDAALLRAAVYYTVSCSNRCTHTGALIRRDGTGTIQLQSTGTSSERHAYQGYAVTGGRWLTSQREGATNAHGNLNARM